MRLVELERFTAAYFKHEHGGMNRLDKGEPMEATILTLALTVIRAVVKNPEKKMKLRSTLLKIRDAITAAFDE